MYDFVIPLGIITFVFLVLTFLTGIRIIKVKVKIHKLLALITLVSAFLHAGLVIYLNYV